MSNSKSRKTAPKAKKKPSAKTSNPKSSQRTPALNAAALTTEDLAEKLKDARTPEELREQSKQFMGKLLTEISRLNAQASFLSRSHTTLSAEVADHLGYLAQCVQALYEHAHLEMPPRMPRLIDVVIKLTEELEEGDAGEMRAAWSDEPHPVYGTCQVIVGTGESARTYGLNGVNPIVARRLAEEFNKLAAANAIRKGHFYYVQMNMIHAGPINTDSVPLSVANDDAQNEASP